MAPVQGTLPADGSESGLRHRGPSRGPWEWPFPENLARVRKDGEDCNQVRAPAREERRAGQFANFVSP